MIVRPYEVGDELKITLQSSQKYMNDYEFYSAEVLELSKQGLAWTGEQDGKILAISGVIPIWEGRASAWAFISEDAGEHMYHVHKAVRSFLRKSYFTRIEATVDLEFAEGVRWMKMLGFELEGYMKAYKPDGSDALLFARVRHVGN